mmetsp:Transcript_31996/g.38931  ORF Transcript_31996/g.38931 Transcript_31996/m.38931 type:complete len:82 (-) Transcript_31996:892-1137(-)
MFRIYTKMVSIVCLNFFIFRLPNSPFQPKTHTHAASFLVFIGFKPYHTKSSQNPKPSTAPQSKQHPSKSDKRSNTLPSWHR